MRPYVRDYIHDEDILNGEVVVYNKLGNEVASFQWGPGHLEHEDAEFMGEVMMLGLDEETA